MTKIDIFSGFLGAGKTTLIKKLLEEAYKGEKVVLIENEFGEIGIDGGFLKESGVQITEMNSGCICCSLVGDFSEALKKVLDEFSPDRVLIEPSGVGKLSDVIKAVQGIGYDGILLNSFTAVVDAKKCKVYMKNFGEFYNDQIENASCIILSHTDGVEQEKLKACIALLREKNSNAPIVSTHWDALDGSKIIEAMEGTNLLSKELKELEKHHHHEHHHDEECSCGHHHEHHHDEECSCGHHHEHHHDEECSCGHHHGHHHADEVFSSWGKETAARYSKESIENILEEIEDENKYGHVLRAKGIVASDTNEWIYFDYIPGEADIRYGRPDVIGRLCVIGAGLVEDELKKLFLLN